MTQSDHPSQIANEDPHGHYYVDPEVAHSLYFQLLRIRRFEEELTRLCTSGDIKMPLHLSIGQEGVAVGVMSALRTTDKIVSNHRCHGHYLAKGGDMKKAMAELFGKATGCSRGRGGSMHLFDDEAGVVCSMPVVGASIAMGVGIALSTRIKQEGKVTISFFGDGAVEEGIFWESLNFASVFNLPIVFVCENNFYATHSPILKRQPSEIIFPRVEPHGIKVYHTDGNDVVEVHKTALQAVEHARSGQPAFIEATTYRLKEHWGGGEDWHLGYRSRQELDHWKEKDPLLKARSYLMEETLEQIDSLEANIQVEIEMALEFAIQSQAPTKNELV